MFESLTTNVADVTVMHQAVGSLGMSAALIAWVVMIVRNIRF